MAWDSVYESEPTNSTYVADTDDSIRNLKVDIRARVAKEHGFNLTESGAQAGHGKHLKGSARAFVSDTSTADPSTVVADDADYSTGRLQVYPTLKRLGFYSGSAWVDLIRNSSGQLFSEVATGTAPMVVASTTKVTNLNADLLDGYDTALGDTVSTVPVRTSNGYIHSVLKYKGVTTGVSGTVRLPTLPEVGATAVYGYETTSLISATFGFSGPLTGTYDVIIVGSDNNIGSGWNSGNSVTWSSVSGRRSYNVTLHRTA